EIDLWGRLANQKKAALASLDAASADYQATRLSLAANTTKAALDLIESEQQAALARRTRKSLQTNLEILDRQLELGNVTANTALEISLSRADVARASSNIAVNERNADASRRRLQTLLGTYPDGSLESLETFPELKRHIPAGLPSQLLLRRPDLIAAERLVDAALQDLSASRKALLPAIRLTGSAGRSSTEEFADLLNPENLVWSIASSLTQTVFQGGRLAANVSLSKARLNELANTYSETALQAFGEVETALAAERYLVAQEASLTEAETESSLAEELALSQFDKGLVDIITVLESQRRAFDARSSLLSTKNARLQNRIDLYLALGGDFDHKPE
ncbi:MAG: TolC family protein, partial [Verrucomicrobiales bacterium]|nr:TolC family protein [Verrucomicrobiales bacterium]